MGNRKGMIYEAVERLNGLMAIGEKRSQVKAAARARGEALFAFSDGKIHSYETRETYQNIVMRFLHWCRATYGFNRLAAIEARADELASAYLAQRIEEGKSAWTLQTERAALRCFFRRGTWRTVSRCPDAGETRSCGRGSQPGVITIFSLPTGNRSSVF